MKFSLNYRQAFMGALLLHLLIGIALTIEISTKRPVLTMTAQQENVPNPLAQHHEDTAIKAVSVNQEEVMKAVNDLKESHRQQQEAELNRQRALAHQAQLAQKKRIEEQQRLEKLKTEAAQLALARKKQIEEEQKHLQQLALQKKAEEKRLADMKKEQANLQKQQEKREAERLALMQKQKEALKREAENELKRQEEAAHNAQMAKEAAHEARKKAELAGVVDKYKALIINAISRQWILPENVDSSMSSQFRIRLAPNGAVLEVSLMRSSGDPILDRSAQSAIYKASPLPVPADPVTFNVFREISLTVRPEHVRG